MTTEQAVAILKQHNAWRRFDGEPFDADAPEMGDPRQVGIAIDVLIALAENATESIDP